MLKIPGRIPVTIHPLFWLVSLFIGWVWTSTLPGTLYAFVVILFSLLVHEFGHALTAIAFKQKARIELAAFGGFTYRQGDKLKLWQEFLVVAAGPIAGLLLGVVAFLLFRTLHVENVWVQFLLQFTYRVNFFWTLINLIPVLPLDGGHLLSIILESIFGFRGVKMAIVAGLTLAISITVLFFVLNWLLPALLFLLLAFEGFRSLKYYRLFAEQDRDSGLQGLMQKGEREVAASKYNEALETFTLVREKTKMGILYTLASQEMAKIYKKQHHYDKGYQILQPLHEDLQGEGLPLFHFLAFKNRDYKAVIQMGNSTYQLHPTYHTALINALAHGAMGAAEAAIGWLECALREGLPSVQQALEAEELDPIRDEQIFRKFLELQEKYSRILD